MKPSPRRIGVSGGRGRASFRRACAAGCAGLLAGVLMSEPASAGSPAHCANDHLGVVDSLTVTQEGGNIKFEFDNYVPAEEEPFDHVGFRVERRYFINGNWKEHVYSIDDTTSPVYLDIDSERDTFTFETFNVQNHFAIAAYCLDGNTERFGRTYPSTYFRLWLQRHPGAPRNLRAEVGETSITLTWEAPDTANRKFAARSYSVERRLVDGTLESEQETTGLTLTSTGLTPGTTYEYWVKPFAYNWDGGASRLEITLPVIDPDVNDDGAVSANDALILYYSYSLRNDLGTGRGGPGGGGASGFFDGTVFRDCYWCPDMVALPGGGSIGRFAVGRYEALRSEWDTCRAGGGCSRVLSYPTTDTHVAAYLSWEDAKDYVEWLSGETGETYRLLSESEWEYAARAGTRTAYWWGDDVRDGEANCQGCPGSIATPLAPQGGKYAPNPFGLYDMHGNIREWVEDCWGGNCNHRVLRGGSHRDTPANVRSDSRTQNTKTNRAQVNGFRVARDLD